MAGTRMLLRLFSLSLGERLWVTTPVAVLLSTVVILAILRAGSRTEEKTGFKLAMVTARVGLAALLTAILYFEAVFVMGYLGYGGPANIIWGVGIPASAAVVACRGNMRRTIMLFPFVLVLGLITTALISALTGLPLD